MRKKTTREAPCERLSPHAALLRASAIGLLLLFSLQALAAPPFGRDTVGTIPSGGLRADFKRGSKFVLSAPVILTHLCGYLDSAGGGTGRQAFRFALYRDRNGVPSSKVTESVETSFPATPNPGGWACLVAGDLPVDPGTYWIMIHTGSNAGILRYYYDGPANWYGAADTFDDGSNESFGSGGAGEGTLSVHALYVPQTEWKIAGSAKVGSTPSGGMRADFKRASSVVLPTRASIYGMSVYIDALGGGTGQQLFTLALYADDHGKPGALVWNTGYPGYGFSGHVGRWYTLEATTFLEAGRYWIAIESGSETGVLRYFMQGTGNWYGNFDPYADTSDPFGPAGAGDGTISAFLVYGPPFEPIH